MRTLQDRVEALAWRIYSNTPRDPAVDFDDLKQCGKLAVMGATRRYDQARGASLETYAIICSRSAMLDLVRRSRRRRVLEFSDAVVRMPSTKTYSDFGLMIEQLSEKSLTPRARKLLDGVLQYASSLDRCTLQALRKRLGMSPHEFSLARTELTKKLVTVGG